MLATGHDLKQAQDRYGAGIVTYLEVSTAETAALQAQVQATTIQARRMSASVLLIKALGGGWDQASLADSDARSRVRGVIGLHFGHRGTGTHQIPMSAERRKAA